MWNFFFNSQRLFTKKINLFRRGMRFARVCCAPPGFNSSRQRGTAPTKALRMTMRSEGGSEEEERKRRDDGGRMEDGSKRLLARCPGREELWPGGKASPAPPYSPAGPWPKSQVPGCYLQYAGLRIQSGAAKIYFWKIGDWLLGHFVTKMLQCLNLKCFQIMF